MAGVARGACVTPRTWALSTRATLLLTGIFILAVASRIVVPLDPVPVTGQTLAVTVIGALFGWRLGTMTVVAWLALTAAGAPLLADGSAGVARFTGATGGYLFAFPIAAALVGLLGERGWNGRLGSALAAMLAGNALCLLVGSARLAAFVGPAGAIAKGVLPFLPGAMLKSLAGAILVRLVWERYERYAAQRRNFSINAMAPAVAARRD